MFLKDHRVLLEIRKKILQQEFSTGSFIKVSKLSDEMLVSAAPIRDALIRLSERGLISHFEGRGYIISNPSPKICLEYVKILFQLAERNIVRLDNSLITNGMVIPEDVCDKLAFLSYLICDRGTFSLATCLADQVTLMLMQNGTQKTYVYLSNATEMIFRALSRQNPLKAIRICRFFMRRLETYLLADMHIQH